MICVGKNISVFMLCIVIDSTFHDCMVPTSLQRFSQPLHKVETSKFTFRHIFQKIYYENEVLVNIVEIAIFQQMLIFCWQMVASTE